MMPPALSTEETFFLIQQRQNATHLPAHSWRHPISLACCNTPVFT